ncbi:MAG: hypothetical protein GXC76_13015 [Rhodanobacteraceae bacterium]|jgi:hypothetical protein|nr:hypothetical protein [Rhodanobacteraceae bacterium]
MPRLPGSVRLILCEARQQCPIALAELDGIHTQLRTPLQRPGWQVVEQIIQFPGEQKRLLERCDNRVFLRLADCNPHVTFHWTPR